MIPPPPCSSCSDFGGRTARGRAHMAISCLQGFKVQDQSQAVELLKTIRHSPVSDQCKPIMHQGG
eukprot:784331-Amphidinium_carterae.2